MQDVKIRLATGDDFELVDMIRAAAFAPVFASFRSLVGQTIAHVAFRDAEREQQGLLRDLLAPGEGRIMLIAERNGAICGFCAINWNPETRIGEIGLNAVNPTMQRQGIAQRLYAVALERLRAEGMSIATVGTGGDHSHQPARAAYAKVGFSAAVPSLHLYRVL